MRNDQEEESEEQNLEISLRMEANMLEDRTKKARHSAWRETRRIEDNAAWEAEKYKQASEEVVCKAMV